MSRTSTNNFFEDFQAGDEFWHVRGKTVTEFDNAGGTLMAMNTAHSHFNEQAMAGSDWGQRLVFGGITSSLVVGLAMQDTGENAVEEVGLDNVRLPSPVFHGDTIHVRTKVLDTEPHPDGTSGFVRFFHEGFNQEGSVVFEGERLVRLHARPG